MKFTGSLPSVLLLASVIKATPVSNDPNNHLTLRQTASGCNYFAAPRCCVPTICQCANGWVYQLNQDNLNRGLHGCDPPWGFIATSNAAFPGYCCREAADGTLIEEGGQTETS
ncbi:hypothetical protein SAMD00023353_3101140 [Rosellinia necatrix]|uniref:Uncharacterized protein n=1 Tax=Rosellinia necatrix TaxID=77044 RepID=A0A1W2TSJ0_ROSNE|nr:hypothetical protein SAMD00023353_3101140 [Rosellinia necatrix]